MVNPSTAEAKEEPPSTVCAIEDDLRFDFREELIVGGYRKPTNEELIAREEEFIKEQRRKELEEMYKALEAEVVKANKGVIIEKTPNRLGRNCVYFVRAKKSLPRPMGSLSDKKRAINSKQPEVGAVAITREGPVGHVAIVVEVLEDTIIIEEGNYSRGYRTLRMIPKSLPLGYWVS